MLHLKSLKYVIDTDVIRNHGIHAEELILVLLTKHCNDIDGLIEDMIEHHKLQRTPTFQREVKVTAGYDEFYNNILLSCQIDVKHDAWIEELAAKMICLFPKGLKDGTSTPWRPPKKELVMRLKKFMEQYQDEKYTMAEILEATKRYVDSFHGDYRLMRALKYFVFKNIDRHDLSGNGYNEVVSELAATIDNMRSGGNPDGLVEFGDLV